MKLSIEVDIEPGEIPLATELLQFLRSLAQQFGVSGPVVKNPKTLLRGVVSKLADSSCLDEVTTDVHSILRNASPSAQDSIFDDFGDVFLEVVFNEKNFFKGQSTIPFLHIIPKLEGKFQQKLRDMVIPKIMQVLLLTRRVDAQRNDFFLYAEAFAGMVFLKYISLDGAVTLLVKLISNQETRAAGLTALGKTAELCCQQLVTQCEPECLEQLRKVVLGVTDKHFNFDINYICTLMNWSPYPQMSNSKAGQEDGMGSMDFKSAGIADLNAASLGGGLGGVIGGNPSELGMESMRGQILKPRTSWQGHKDTIYAMCYDSTTKRLVSGGKEGVCVVWSSDGRIEQKVGIPDHSIIALDMHPNRKLLFASGVSNDKGQRKPACIAIFGHETSWQQRGLITRPENSLISCVRAVFHSGSDGFATGEEVHGTMEERVCYYDLSRASDFANLQPEIHFTGHSDLVTCVNSTPIHPMMIFSGSRDKSIMIWDRRTGNSVGILGEKVMGKIIAHDQMVTWVDIGGMDLVSTGGDGCVAHWDLRKMSNAASGCPALQRTRVGSQPDVLLKVAANNAPNPGLVAVAKLDSLHLVDLRKSSNNVIPAQNFPDRQYFDLKWSDTDNLLFAASERIVDVYQLC